MTPRFDRKKRRSKSEFVYQTLKEAIISGQLQPGVRLVLADLADKLNVSTQPVREALMRLDTENYVQWTLNVGAVVSGISVDDLKDDIPILRELEGLATREAAKRITPAILKKLEEMLGTMGSYAESYRSADYGRLNREFHRVIHCASENRRLIKILDDLWDHRERLRTVFFLSPMRAFDSLQEHEAIIAALREGDGNKAGLLVEEHRMKAAAELLKYLEANEALNGTAWF